MLKLLSQQSSKAAKQQSSKAAKQQSSKAAKQQSSKAAKQQSSKAAKQQSSKAAKQQSSNAPILRFLLPPKILGSTTSRRVFCCKQSKTKKPNKAATVGLSALTDCYPPLMKHPTKELSESEVSRVVEMAWEDRTPFEVIEATFGLSEPETIKLMRRTMKPSSFRLWRKRVTGRVTKHRKLRGFDVGRGYCPTQYKR